MVGVEVDVAVEVEGVIVVVSEDEEDTVGAEDEEGTIPIIRR